MRKEKVWDELREMRKTNPAQRTIGSFLRSEIPNTRKMVDEIIKARSPIQTKGYRLILVDLIRKKVGR